MSQLLRAPSHYVAFYFPAVCFSSCEKCGMWKVELISQCYLWHCSILLPQVHEEYGQKRVPEKPP